MAHRPALLILAVGILAVLVAVPALAAKPSSPPGQAKDKERTAESPITLTGTIDTSTDAEGEVSYTLTDGGTTYTLEAGPRWFFTDAYPLDPYVGQDVTIEGEIEEGSTEVDVLSVNGVALREPGKPPWAGGWKRVGSIHPGWTQEKADRHDAKFGGDCWPPGHCKDKAARPDKAAKPAKADKPDESDDPSEPEQPEAP